MKTTFVGAQFRYLLRSLPSRTKLWHRAFFFYEVLRLPANYAKLSYSLRSAGPPVQGANAKCVVILLSHNRPQNLEILVRGALQNAFVERVVVSNSNPKVRIAEWIKSKDDRLVLFDETQATLPGHRFVLAERAGGEYFLSVDDDIFLTPWQWARFFQALLQAKSVPHGITGQVYRPGTTFTNGGPFHHRENVDEEVDVLIGAYAFTRRHLRRVFEFADSLELGPLSQVGNGEDILLSFAGEGRARIHNLGRLFLCTSTSLQGVALWKSRRAFWEERSRLFERVWEVRQAMGSPRPGTHYIPVMSGNLATAEKRN
jgi:hypothetical protein